jgi:hypothetical protein
MIIFRIAEFIFIAKSEELKNRDLGSGKVSRRARKISVRNIGMG